MLKVDSRGQEANEDAREWMRLAVVWEAGTHNNVASMITISRSSSKHQCLRRGRRGTAAKDR